MKRIKQIEKFIFNRLRKRNTFSLDASCNFFVQGGNSKILLLDPKELEEIYCENYLFRNYKKFVREVLNQKIVITTENKGIAFELDKEISDIYRNIGFSDFREQYCVNSREAGKFWLKSNIQEDQLFSVFYYFFINNYLTEFDDYMGNYYLSETSHVINKKMKTKKLLQSILYLCCEIYFTNI